MDTYNNNIYNSLKECSLCPRMCKVNRIDNEKGMCRAPSSAKVSLAALHQWEEPCISGENNCSCVYGNSSGRGSGAVFFTGCNLKCVFCQNFEISQHDYGKEVSIEHLAQIFLNLQKQGAYNINLVSPTHFVPQIKEALVIAKSNNLNIPIIYNTNGYENVETLSSLEGLVDVYLPDLKYYNDNYAIRYSKAPHYFEYAAKAILEMYRQVGSPQFNDKGLITKGLIIRHLMLPGLLRDSKNILKWISENLPKSIYISLMSQYTPMHKANDFKELNSRIHKIQYDACIEYFFKIGLENGYVQELSSATDTYTPAFDLRGV